MNRTSLSDLLVQMGSILIQDGATADIAALSYQASEIVHVSHLDPCDPFTPQPLSIS